MESHELTNVPEHQFTLDSFTNDTDHSERALMGNVTVSVAGDAIDTTGLVSSFSNAQTMVSESGLTTVSAPGGIGHVTLADISSNLRRLSSGHGGLLTGTVISPESLRAVTCGNIFQTLPDSLTHQQRAMNPAAVANVITDVIHHQGDIVDEGGGAHGLSVGINLVAGSLGALGEKEVGRATGGLNDHSALSMEILQADENSLSAITSGSSVVFTTNTNTTSLVSNAVLEPAKSGSVAAFIQTPLNFKVQVHSGGDTETLDIGDPLQPDVEGTVGAVPSSSLLEPDPQLIVGGVEGMDPNEPRQLPQTPFTCRITSQDLARLVQTVEQVGTDELDTAAGGTVQADNVSLQTDNVSLVHVGGVPSVELSSTGQLVIRQGSVVYTQDGENIVAMTQDEAGNLSTAEGVGAGGDGTVTVSIAAPVPVQVSSPAKRRVQKAVKGKGGWPKGKRRRKDVLTLANAPKPTTTAYTMFINDKKDSVRADHPELVGSEVAAFLGKTWTNLSDEEKKKYRDQEKKDRERYLKEIKEYQATSSCQVLLKKTAKDTMTGFVGTEEEMTERLSSLTKNDVLGCNYLHCKVCDIYFSNSFNMGQHVLGKQHMNALATKICEMDKETLGLEELEKQETKELGGSATCHSCECFKEGMPNTEGFRSTFMDLHYERELELRELRLKHAASIHEQMTLRRNFKELQESLRKMENDHGKLKVIGSTTQAKLDGLYRMILFLT